MLTLKPLDESCPIHQQLDADVSPVILVNLFTVEEADIPALMEAWEADANWMKQQAGYISTQLHRAVGESHAFLNYAVWESVAHFKAAFSHPDFRAALAAYPSSVVASPHLFERVAVPNLCTK
jgi:heme-degrading monooxygenase HmoA